MIALASDWLRSVWSIAPVVGLVPSPENRPNGISAVVRVRGNEEWIEPSLRSVVVLADEVIVLDNGASVTTQQMMISTQESLGERVKLLACPGMDILQVSNRGLREASYRWVVRWDADLVGHTAGPSSLAGLRDFLLGLDRRRYHVVSLAAVELAGDLFHQFPDQPIRYDPQAATLSSALRYVYVDRVLAPGKIPLYYRAIRGGALPARVRYETLHLPRYYRPVRFEAPAIFHCNVKSARHTLLRHFWLEWLRSSIRQTISLEEFTRKRVQEAWGVEGLEDALPRFMREYCAPLIPFDSSRWGEYPELLRPYLSASSYRVIRKHGAIVGRSDVVPYDRDVEDRPQPVSR